MFHWLSAGPDDSEEGGAAAVVDPYGTKSGLRNKNDRRTTGETAANVASRNFGAGDGSEPVDDGGTSRIFGARSGSELADDGGAGKACRRGKVEAVMGRTR